MRETKYHDKREKTCCDIGYLRYLHYICVEMIIILGTSNKHMKKEKQVIDENVEYFLREGMLPNGIKPIVMSNVEEYLRSQGAINTQELLEVINKYR